MSTKDKLFQLAAFYDPPLITVILSGEVLDQASYWLLDLLLYEHLAVQWSHTQLPPSRNETGSGEATASAEKDLLQPVGESERWRGGGEGDGVMERGGGGGRGE